MNLDPKYMNYLASNIVTRREISDRVGVHLRTVHGWTERRLTNKFPKPIRQLSGDKAGRPLEIYWWPAIAHWYDTYIPHHGRRVNGTRPIASLGK